MRDEVKAGIVIVGSLLLLALLVLGVSGVSLWERHDVYTVRLKSSGGLDQGAAVRLGGLRIGSVRGMRIPPEDASQVEITLGITRGTAIPQGTWATVATLGLLGEAFVQLTTERHTAERLPPGSRIPSREPATVADVIQRVQAVAARADGVLADVGALVAKDLTPLLQRLQSAVARAEGAAGDVGTLVTNDVAPLLRRTQGLIAAAERTLDHADAFVAPDNRERVERILAGLDQAVAETAAALRGTMRQLEGSLRRVDDAVAFARNVMDENRADLRESVRLARQELVKVDGTLTRLDGVLGATDATLASARRLLERVDAAVGDNRDRMDETVANLERSSRNLKELTQQLKERPWSALFPDPGPPKPGLEPLPPKETRR
jgi:phospholipid/cholesterol/gamma-HCH transport system substrate-binding protein